MGRGCAKRLADIAETAGQMAELAGSAMDRATQALLTADVITAEQVIASHAAMTELSQSAQDTAFAVLALHSPVAGDLRQVVAGIRVATNIERMGALAVHVARVAQRRHPDPAVPAPVAAQFAEMGRIAVTLADTARQALATRDPRRGALLDGEDEAMDALHRHLFTLVADQRWTHGVQAAVDVTLLGRFYERFADHAVAVGGHVVFGVTGTTPVRRRRRISSAQSRRDPPTWRRGRRHRDMTGPPAQIILSASRHQRPRTGSRPRRSGNGPRPTATRSPPAAGFPSRSPTPTTTRSPTEPRILRCRRHLDASADTRATAANVTIATPTPAVPAT